MNHNCFICLKQFDEEDMTQLDEDCWLCNHCRVTLEDDLMEGIDQMDAGCEND